MMARDDTTFQRWTEELRAKRGLLNGERVKMVREFRGMARYMLARKLGIPAKELEKREAGWCFWAEAEASLLSGFTDFPVKFFVQDDPPIFAPLFTCGHNEDGEHWCEVSGIEETQR